MVMSANRGIRSVSKERRRTLTQLVAGLLERVRGRFEMTSACNVSGDDNRNYDRPVL